MGPYLSRATGERHSPVLASWVNVAGAKEAHFPVSREKSIASPACGHFSAQCADSLQNNWTHCKCFGPRRLFGRGGRASSVGCQHLTTPNGYTFLPRIHRSTLVRKGLCATRTWIFYRGFFGSANPQMNDPAHGTGQPWQP